MIELIFEQIILRKISTLPYKFINYNKISMKYIRNQQNSSLGVFTINELNFKRYF